MATMLAHLRIEPGREAEFERLAARLYQATHHDEHGVARYEYWRAAEPGHYYMLGSFDGYDGFIAHQVSEHHMAAAAELRAVIADIRLEWIDAVDLANPLPPTDAGAEPKDQGPIERDYRSRQPVAVQQWWVERRGR